MNVSTFVVETHHMGGTSDDAAELLNSAPGVISVEPLSVWLETRGHTPTERLHARLHARCDETNRALNESLVARDRDIGSLNVRIRQLEAEKERILAAVREMLLNPDNGEWEDDHSFVQRMLAFGMPKLSNDVIIKVEYRGTLELRVEDIERHFDVDDLKVRVRQALNLRPAVPDVLCPQVEDVLNSGVELIEDSISIERFTLTTDS